MGPASSLLARTAVVVLEENPHLAITYEHLAACGRFLLTLFACVSRLGAVDVLDTVEPTYLSLDHLRSVLVNHLNANSPSVFLRKEAGKAYALTQSVATSLRQDGVMLRQCRSAQLRDASMAIGSPEIEIERKTYFQRLTCLLPGPNVPPGTEPA